MLFPSARTVLIDVRSAANQIVRMSYYDSVVKIHEIREDASIADSEKEGQINDILKAMSEADRRRYFELFTANMYNLGNRGKKAFNVADKGAFGAFEFENMEFEFSQQMGMISAIYYALKRLNDFDESKREVAREFIQHAFGAKDDHTLILSESERTALHTIGEIDPDLLEDIHPSFEQWGNFHRHTEANWEPLKMLTKAMLGRAPTMEARMYFHGMFKSEADLDRYRVKNAKNILGSLYAIPVGKECVLDPYRDMLNSTMIYDPNDKEVELLFKRKAREYELEAMNLLKRSKNSQPADPAVMERIRMMRGEGGEPTESDGPMATVTRLGSSGVKQFDVPYNY